MEITTQEYRELVEKAKAGEILSRALITMSELSYRGNALVHNTDAINAVLKATAWEHYNRRLEELRRNKGEAEEAEGGEKNGI